MHNWSGGCARASPQGHRRGRGRIGDREGGATRAALAFERLWEETCCRGVIASLAGVRSHSFVLERAVFLTVLPGLLSGGSDRATDRWRQDYRIEGVESLELHQLYRAMAWLGEELAADQQDCAASFAPCCMKDVMEEDLFARRRDLFTTLNLVFMDTTRSLFRGRGGQTLGRHGFSKDHRSDLNQMIPGCSTAMAAGAAQALLRIPGLHRRRPRDDQRATIAELEARD